jgi:hypothetical protein
MGTTPGDAAALKAKLDALVKDAEEAEEKAVAARRRARAARTLLKEEEQTAAALKKVVVAVGTLKTRYPRVQVLGQDRRRDMQITHLYVWLTSA